MAFIDWSEEFCTGIEDVDQQHQHLVEIVNKFDSAMAKGKGTRVMGSVLTDLIGYTQEHFAHEERLMAEADYAGLKLHQAQHRQLLQKVERFQFDFSQGQRISKKVRDLLKHWLIDHILTEDMAFARALEAPAEQAEAPEPQTADA